MLSVLCLMCISFLLFRSVRPGPSLASRLFISTMTLEAGKPGMYLCSSTIRSRGLARSSDQSVSFSFPTPHSHLVFLCWPYSREGSPHIVTEKIPEKDPRLTLIGETSTPAPVIMDSTKPRSTNPVAGVDSILKNNGGILKWG